jgi:hypothetical protein
MAGLLQNAPLRNVWIWDFRLWWRGLAPVLPWHGAQKPIEAKADGAKNSGFPAEGEPRLWTHHFGGCQNRPVSRLKLAAIHPVSLKGTCHEPEVEPTGRHVLERFLPDPEGGRIFDLQGWEPGFSPISC